MCNSCWKISTKKIKFSKNSPNSNQALRHEHDLPGEVALEERPRSRARVLEPPRPDPGLKPKDRGRMGNNVRIEKVR